ncbi:MAG TPA: VCBS repeat-containing protein, partial [Urbifossiella sp.]|nr:VCBS repeat-containing protein [Urbifossiella sp.]
MTDRVVPAATHLFAVGEDLAGSSVVQVYHNDGSAAFTLNPFPAGFTGGVRVATGDVTGDGTDDVVVATGTGGGPEVKVYDGTTGNVVFDFWAYDPSFRGGVNVAVGDVTGDGRADIVTGTGAGGGPNVKVFDGATGGLVDSFFAYDSTFRGGVNVAAGDVTGDGRADVVTGTGVGGGPRVQVFDGATEAEIGNFFAYDASVRSGVTVAAGDLDGDGRAEIVTGVGAGAGPNVRAFNGQTDAQVGSFFAYDPGFLGGVAVGVTDFNGKPGILTAPGPSTGGYAEVFDGTSELPVGFFRPFPAFDGGE